MSAAHDDASETPTRARSNAVTSSPASAAERRADTNTGSDSRPLAGRADRIGQAILASQSPTQVVGKDDRENLGAVEQQRVAVDRSLFDMSDLSQEITTLMQEVQMESKKYAVFHQAVIILGGLAKIGLGVANIATLGVAAPITGPLTALVDAGVSASKEALASGSKAEGAAASVGKSGAVVAATRAIGPVTAGGINMVPVAGGAVTAGMGIKDIYDGASASTKPDPKFAASWISEAEKLKIKIDAKLQKLVELQKKGNRGKEAAELEKNISMLEQAKAILGNFKAELQPYAK